MSKELQILNEMIKNKTGEVLAILTEQEEKMLRLRFGLEDGKPKTLQEVGKTFGISSESVKKEEAKILRKLRTTGMKIFNNKFIEEIKPLFDALKENEKDQIYTTILPLFNPDVLKKLTK